LDTSNNRVFVGLALNLRMLAFSAAVAAFTCLLFGLLPAWRAPRGAPATAMRTGGPGGPSGRGRNGVRRAPVTAQVARSLVLLVGGVVVVRSLQNILKVQPGFRPEGVISVNIDLGPKYPKEQREATFTQLEEVLKRQPEVISFGSIGITPLSGSGWNQTARAD